MNSVSDNGGENAVALGPAVLLAVFVGLGVIIFTFLLKWIRQERSEKGNAKDEKPEKVKGSSTAASGKHGKKEQAGAVKSSSKKKLTDRENRRSARANEKGFNHPWLLATLKGHSGRVLDMDFSANGKYLVSCGDEDPDPGGTPHPVRRKSPSSTCNSSASSSESNNSQGLTRRQRKNRKRETTIMPVENKAEQDLRKSPRIKAGKKGSSAQPKSSESSNGKMQRRKEMRRRIEAYHNANHVFLNLEPLEEYGKMKISKNMFVKLLKQHYILTPDAMGMLGYPLRPEFHLYYNNNLTVKKEHRLDVYAEEFIPRNDSGDSGNGSSSSSEEEGSSGSEGSEEKRRAKLAMVPVKRKDLSIKTCARCGSFFYTTSTQYITLDRCLYHPGRITTSNGDYGPMSHSCCGQPNGSLGCSSAPLHVWSGPRDRIVSSSFVETETPKEFRPDHDYGVYSLDCEMSYTVSGLEVVKITMVDIRGFPIYNEYVKPLTEIVDFNTQFSGIVADDFIKNPTKTLAQVQKDLKKLICSETVLIGHGLENDLRALKLIHKTVVDTAFTFPHYKGLPFRRSLKNLAKFCLKKEIQVGDHGHDSFEDARTCMELMLLRIRMDFPTNSG